MNGYYVGENQGLPGSNPKFDNGKFIFTYFHSFINSQSSGFYTLLENSNASIIYGEERASLDGHGN